MNNSRFRSMAILVVVLSILSLSSCYVVEPGKRGVKVTLGKVEHAFLPEGFGMKLPSPITRVIEVSVRQSNRQLDSECFSSDLQQVTMHIKVLYRIPETSVVHIYQDFAGDPFDTLVAPRVQEALKEVTAMNTAETIVKKREEIKSKALELARAKVGNILVVEDLVLENIALSAELEKAIEAKMVQEQEAAKARFIQQKTEIEANTAIIKARGEAQAISIQGEALKRTPDLVQLRIVEKWDGKAPLVVGDGKGASVILPIR